MVFSTAYTMSTLAHPGLSVWFLTLDGAVLHPVALNILKSVPSGLLVNILNLAAEALVE